jgi:hypothetical protein
MIIVKIMAGMGNQLFQYACGRALALRLGTELKIWREPDSSGSENSVSAQPLRPFRLFDFSIQAEYATSDALSKMQYKVLENPFTYFPQVLTLPDNIMLEGFWQSERYFSDFTNDIRQELDFLDPNYMRQARGKINLIRKDRNAEVVAVHVRRGDYVSEKTKGIFHNLSTAWFENAMSRWSTHALFMFFSDDMAWCQETFQGDHILYSPGSNDLEDLALMRACDGYIISNSSFSWWGAWMSDKTEPKVVGPSPNFWFGEKLTRFGQHDARHILPDRWMKQDD